MNQSDHKKGCIEKFQTFIINRMIPPTVANKGSLIYWRANVLFVLLFTATVLCTIALFAAIALVVREQVWGLAIFDAFAYAICFSLLISTRLSLKTRSVIALLMCYLVGFVVIILVGPLSGGPIWLFAFAVLVGVLFGSKAALLAVALNGFTLIVIGWLIHTGRIGETFPLFNTPQAVVAASLNFLVVNIMVSLSVAMLVKGLITTIGKEKNLLNRLEQEKMHLLETKRNLELEIDERKQAQKALMDSNEKYKELANSLPQVVFETDINGTILYANRNAFDIFGYTENDLTKNLNALQFLIPEDHEKALKNMQRVLTGDNIGGVEYTAITDTGNQFSVVIHANRILQGEKAVGLRGIIIDLTQQKKSEEERSKLESQLQQAQKMEAIGTLAGGIAHDFNNMLMGIQGRTSLMLMGKDSSHTDFEHLKGIEDGVKSATYLTRQLLGFARGGKYELKTTNLNNIVNKSTIMFGRTKKEVSIHQKIEKDLWTVEVDRGQIEQVLLNLYVNAWQAMSGTCELYLETGNIRLDEIFVKPYGTKPGRYARISVTDTGIGMDKQTQQRVFDPFFTTKQMSRGTGLGLASAYGIIQSHGGIINVHSKKGHGATFNIYLPTSGKAVKEEIEPLEEILKGSETLLLIDDEEMILAIGRELLETLGYSVFPAKSGQEGIDIYQKSKDQIDMVILDMIMPGMGGNETYDMLKEINPELKSLLCSGYSIDGFAKTILAKGCDGFIQKPFGLSDLSQKVREILDKKK